MQFEDGPLWEPCARIMQKRADLGPQIAPSEIIHTKRACIILLMCDMCESRCVHVLRLKLEGNAKDFFTLKMPCAVLGTLALPLACCPTPEFHQDVAKMMHKSRE